MRNLAGMNIQFASLNSGSNGNCYYIGNDRDAVFVDAGISCRETSRRMLRLGLLPEKVRAIFISHEHGDHTRGVEYLSRKYQIPVYMTETTCRSSYHRPGRSLQRPFTPFEPVQAGTLSVLPFPKSHDGMDPHSFTVTGNGVTVGVFTDIGYACDAVREQFSRCHAAFLEANYDEEMLKNGRYPAHLKQRIRGRKGHLSNDQALELFTWYRSPLLHTLVLSHLSAENNHPQLVAGLFAPHANGTRIAVASRYEPSELFTLTNGEPL